MHTLRSVPVRRREAPAASEGPLRRIVVGISVLVLLAVAPSACQPGQGAPAEQDAVVVDGDTIPVREEIRSRIEAGLAPNGREPEGAGFLVPDGVVEFYTERRFEPAWLDGGAPTPAARHLRARLEAAEAEGLPPESYRLGRIDSLGVEEEQGRREAVRRAELDLLFTDAFLRLATHLQDGAVDPASRSPRWEPRHDVQALVGLLRDALAETDPGAALDDVRPAVGAYAALRDALEGYRARVERGGWGPVPTGEALRMGDEEERVVALRDRLAATGDFPGDPGAVSEPRRFDEELHRAVVAFQERHGLARDGVVGRATLRALNVPAEERVRQIQVNLERWRWMPGEPGDRYVLVNIPAFETRVVDGGETVMTLRSVVGTPYRQTPVMTDEISYLVLAPAWHIPPGIAATDQLPRIRQDPGYLAARNKVLLERDTHRTVDPDTVDFSEMGGAEFNRRFRIRQEPGPGNAMGHVKFMFPNEHNVYLHDTPARDLFTHPIRPYSSGCIRVEHALRLAEHLLADLPDWDMERIERTVARGVERTIFLPEPVPVHIQYWTAWVGDDGRVHFREDIYRRDDAVYRALTASPPIP